MRVCHNLSADFDDPNLIASAGLVPVLALAQKAGLPDLVADHVSVPGSPGANAHLKVATLVAGMVAGADSIEDMDLARHGGMPKIFAGCRAPTTLGTHLRGYQFGHVRQLDAVASRLLVNLAQVTPLLGGADQVAYLDIDDTIRATHGYAKQGVGYGYTGVKGSGRASRDPVHADGSPGDRRHPVAQGQHVLGSRGAPAGRRRPVHRQEGRGDRAGDGARGQCLLQP